MIWHIILLIYLLAGLFMGYRIHVYQSRKFYKQMRERVALLADFYDECEHECAILRTKLRETSDDIALALLHDEDLHKAWDQLNKLRENIDLTLKETQNGPTKN